MNSLIKWLLVLALVGAGYQDWNKQRQARSLTADGAPIRSSNGFVALPTVDGASKNVVMVVAAQNCTKEAAARADSLTAALTRSGIPVNRTRHVSFSFTNADEGGRERISEVMKGELPIVFLNGRGKANPQLDEVVAEFQSGK